MEKIRTIEELEKAIQSVTKWEKSQVGYAKHFSELAREILSEEDSELFIKKYNIQ